MSGRLSYNKTGSGPISSRVQVSLSAIHYTHCCRSKVVIKYEARLEVEAQLPTVRV